MRKALIITVSRTTIKLIVAEGDTVSWTFSDGGRQVRARDEDRKGSSSFGQLSLLCLGP